MQRGRGGEVEEGTALRKEMAAETVDQQMALEARSDVGMPVAEVTAMPFRRI